LAVDPQGVPVGLLSLTWWTRTAAAPKTTHARQTRPLEDKETRHWVRTVQAASAALDERGVRGWFQIDREGDGYDLLLTLKQTTHWWTVRSNADRCIELEDGDTQKLRFELSQQSMSGLYTLPVAGRPGRLAREATMMVRFARVVLRLRDKRTDRITLMPVMAVWAREMGTTPANEAPLDWLLYTNHPVETLEDALLVVWGYSQRWRVEEFHRTWKAGDCDIESSQLGSPEALERWATILAAVAVRIERLKRLARTQPNKPATIELSPPELRALKMLKFGDNPPEHQPTIGEAILWLAELGGFANKYSGRQPGATVLGRGLKYLRPAARILEMQHM
jgi:Transposase Tn5 dimerisation domain